MKISDRVPPFFKTNPHILPTPFLWEKSEPPPFLAKFLKLKPPFPWRGVPTMEGQDNINNC